ncbi:MAG: methyltransferase [Halobacteriaceae archaeon]
MVNVNGHPAGEQSQSSADLQLKSRVGDHDIFQFHTRDGVVSPDSFRTSELRLLDVLADESPETLLVPNANYGVVGVVMAAFCDAVWLTETSARAAQLCRYNAIHNQMAETTSIALTADLRALPTTVDAVALAPAAYEPNEVVNQRIADALSVLKPDGTCYLSTSQTAGLSHYRETLQELCDDMTVVDDQGNDVTLRANRPESLDPPQYAAPNLITPSINGVDLSLVTYPGLFSASELDEGTRTLARSLEISDGESVLDLGCGYGPLGLYIAQKSECDVTISDDNCIATACASLSADKMDVSLQNEITADAVSGVRNQRFDRIVCNPPTHAGSGVLHDMIRGASKVLRDGGQMQLVHHKGVDFAKYIEPYFEAIDSVSEGNYSIVTVN